MPPSTPFIDRDTGTLDGAQILSEAIPLAKLIGLVAALALIPVAISLILGVFPPVLMLVAQFIIAVGTGVVLLYIIARGIHLAEK